MKKVLLICVIFWGFLAQSQTDNSNFRFKIFTVEKDSIFIDSVSINPFIFRVFDNNKMLIDSTEYSIDFSKSLLIINKEKYPTIEVEYYAYPEFLTKTYYKFDKNLVVPYSTPNATLYSYSNSSKNRFFKPFDGLNTSGSISRGLTIGSNQDAVVNSALDLQIAGKISEKVTLRASITDSNIPIQENGYTQQLNEFDRVFIELFTDNWSIKAGDVNLQTSNTYFGNFMKKVSGVSVNGTIQGTNSETTVFASGALVRGKFTTYKFVGQENNQGPYRLFGPNNEQYIVIISGSETVYVNGLPIKRGENNDYIIDYNTAEITFMSTFPVNANMRISVDFQYSDQNYTRFITHNGGEYKGGNLRIGASYYLESDSKNQPVQQDLTDIQKQILANAGNDKRKMIAPSAVLTPFSENRILYKKELISGIERFIYSTNPTDELYAVRFSNLGNNLGAYQLGETIATGKIYEYVGENMGDFAPVIQLVAPNKLQLAIINAGYNPSDKTDVYAEIALSQNDQNLFSDIDNDTNDGYATKVIWKQTILDQKWGLKSNLNFESVSENFTTVQRFRNIEFNRDWNVENSTGNQYLVHLGFTYGNKENGEINYAFEFLNFTDSFDGNRNTLSANLLFDNLKIDVVSSLLNSKTLLVENFFFRLYSVAKYSFKKSWVGVKVNTENNQRTEIATQNLSPLSQKFLEYEGFFGIGDSTNVFAEIGVNIRANDSIKNNSLNRVSNAQTYFINTQLIQNKNTRLSLFVNYRTVENIDFEDTKALNSRLLYNQQLFNRMVSLNTVYETASGNLAQQEFTYVEVEPGQGFYTWIDYNGNGIQELNEFEVAQFPDEATFLRVALPTLNYIPIHQTKLSQSININLQQWSNKSGAKKIMSHFQNQTFLLFDNKQTLSEGKFNLNPFDTKNSLGLNSNFKNSLFFNRGKQRYSTSYSIINSKVKTSFTIDNVENKIKLHQLQFVHRLGDFWLVDAKGTRATNKNTSSNYTSRNYDLDSYSFNPKISYLYNSFTSLDVYYEFKNKENQIGNLETLDAHKMGVSFKGSNQKKTSVNADFNFYINNFVGNQNSPVAYQMLEGLQPGKNFTWSLLWQQRLTNFLDLNISYLGRKSETSKTIHTGTVQLRANF